MNNYATRVAGGKLRVIRRAEVDSTIIGDGMVIIGPDDPEYDAWDSWIEKQEQGEGKKHLLGKHDQRTHGHPNWQGPIKGATPKQEDVIRMALGKVPTHLMPTDWSVTVTKTGAVRAMKGTIHASILRKPDEAEHALIHEVGHANQYKVKNMPEYKKIPVVTKYAFTSKDEAFAEAFAFRIRYGKEKVPLMGGEVVFKKLGI